MKTRRVLYAGRLLFPGLRKRHYLESLVGPLGFWDKLQRYQFNLLVDQGLLPHHKLLDIGCGPLQGGIPLIQYLNVNGYVGIDSSARALNAAHHLIAENRLGDKNPVVIHSENFGATEIGNRNFDFMWASQVLYYFDEGSIARLLTTISQRLARSGRFLGDIIGPGHYEHYAREHGYILHSVHSLSEQAKPFGLQVESLGEIGMHGYPKPLSLKTNLLLSITHRTAEQS